MRVGLIYNEGAGDGRSAADLRGLLERYGHEVQRTAHVSDGLDGWREAGLDLLVAAGGDGTIGAAVCTLSAQPLAAPLAILPMGTANNIASSLDVSPHIEAAIEAWPAQRVRRLDVGVATGPWGERCFVESLGGGLVTHGIVVMERRRYTSPTPEAQLARARAAHADLLAQLAPARWRVRIDDQVVDDEFLALEVLNMPAVGPNLWLAPASPFDARFTITGIPPAHRQAWIDRLRGVATAIPRPRVWQGREIEVVVGDRLHVDDTVVESDGAVPVRVRFAAERVPVLLPRHHVWARTATKWGDACHTTSDGSHRSRSLRLV